MTYTKETLIGEALDRDVTLSTYFIEMGMHCLGCPSARGETIAEACEVHGVDCDTLLRRLNGHSAAKNVRA